jgi:hypothetical protein
MSVEAFQKNITFVLTAIRLTILTSPCCCCIPTEFSSLVVLGGRFSKIPLMCMSADKEKILDRVYGKWQPVILFSVVDPDPWDS